MRAVCDTSSPDSIVMPVVRPEADTYMGISTGQRQWIPGRSRQEHQSRIHSAAYLFPEHTDLRVNHLSWGLLVFCM